VYGYGRVAVTADLGSNDIYGAAEAALVPETLAGAVLVYPSLFLRQQDTETPAYLVLVGDQLQHWLQLL
jgi:hypothetical protein